LGEFLKIKRSVSFYILVNYFLNGIFFIDSCLRRNDKAGGNLFFPFSLGGKGLEIGGVFENKENPGIDTPHK
jgi:hypothetical protein